MTAAESKEGRVSLQSLDSVMLAKICSYLTYKEVMEVVSLLNKSIRSQIIGGAQTFSEFFKALNQNHLDFIHSKNAYFQKNYNASENHVDLHKRARAQLEKIDSFVLEQSLINSKDMNSISRIFAQVQPSGNFAPALVGLLRKCLKSATSLPIMPMDQSSCDYNQTVHRTVNKHDPDQFWSSGGSETAEADEWLSYKIPFQAQENSPGKDLSLEGCALITKFSVKVFNPSRLQLVDFFYSPKQVQLEIGNSPDHYHYKSKVFEMNT